MPLLIPCRENDLLREQLKRYVGMVKQQQGEERGDEDGEKEEASKKLSEVRPGSEYLALRLEVNVNVQPNARIELGSILAFVVRLH